MTLAEHTSVLLGDILELADGDGNEELLEQKVYRALERVQREALLLAVTECEAHAASASPEMSVWVQQLAIRLAKLALDAAPKGPGPRKATR